MITTLTGVNLFSLGRELRQLADGFVQEQGDLAVERLDGEEASLERLQEALTSLPFLASKKLVVLREPSKNKQFVEKAADLLDAVPETTDVILVEPKLDKRQSYYKYLKKSTDFREFPELDQNALARWVIEAAKEQKASISSADARYLIERVGVNQQLVGNELDKLVLYDPKISRDTIDLLTDATPQSTIFQLLEAAFAGNTKVVLRLYEEQRALKVEPQQIIALLAWQLHILAIIKTARDRTAQQIAAEARLSPYVVQRSMAIARALPLARLKELVQALLTIDSRSKRESIDLDEALQHYLLTLKQSAAAIS